jgi:hypothetical protein
MVGEQGAWSNVTTHGMTVASVVQSEMTGRDLGVRGLATVDVRAFRG